MKRAIVGAFLAVTLLQAAAPACAMRDEYDDSQSHPLRVAAYLLHPVGVIAEWLVFRPIHFVVSQPVLEQVFGHRPHGEHRAF